MKNIWRKIRSSICLIIAILLLTGCQSLNGQNTAQKPPSTPTESCPQYSPNLNAGVTSVPSESLNPSQIVRGQKIYIPFYSQLYEPEGLGRRLDLRGTLSIRNTSETDKIRITRVHYFNSDGTLVKKCLEGKHSVLSPLASTDFVVEQNDRTGGSGANFIVEWVAETEVYEPIVEALMVSTSSQQGISFISQGRVIN